MPEINQPNSKPRTGALIALIIVSVLRLFGVPRGAFE